MSNYHDPGVRDLLEAAGLVPDASPAQQQQSGTNQKSGTNPLDALKWAVNHDLDPELVGDMVRDEDGELYAQYGHLPLGDRLMAAGRHLLVADALIDGRLDDAFTAAGDDADLVNRVAAEEADFLDTEDLAAQAMARLQDGELARQDAVGQAYQAAIEKNPSLANDPTFQGLIGNIDLSQIQTREDADRAFSALGNVAEHVKHEEETAKLNRELLIKTGVSTPDGEDAFGNKVDLPEPDLEALLDSEELARIMSPETPKMGDASGETISATFAAVEAADEDWTTLQKTAADRRADQLAREAGQRDTEGRDWAAEWEA